MARKARNAKISRSVTVEAWLVVGVIILTVWLFQSGMLARGIEFLAGLGPVPASLIAGAAYSTFLTTPLAVGSFVTMGEMHLPIWQIAAIGALGATIVDLLLMKGAGSPLALLIVRTVTGRSSARFRARLKRVPGLRWIAAILGGVLVAAPLPTDELGVVFFSASGLRAFQILPLIFVADFIGVYAIVSAASFFS